MTTLAHKYYLADEDTNAFLRDVYHCMMTGLLVSELTAYSVSHSPQILNILFGKQRD